MMLWTGVGLVGVMWLIVSLIESGSLSLRGNLFLIAGAFLWAVGSLHMRRKTNHSVVVASISSMTKQMLLGGILLTVVGILVGELNSLDLSRISFQSLMGMLYMITIGSLIGFPIFVWLLQETSEFVANSFAFVSPVVAIIMGSTILNESFGLQTIVAAFILLGSAMIIIIMTSAGLNGKGKLTRSAFS